VYEGAYPYFITSTVTYWIPVFCRDDYFRILSDGLTYCAVNKGLCIHGGVIMPNRFHLICSQEEGKLSAVMAILKQHASKAVAKKLSEDGRTA